MRCCDVHHRAGGQHGSLIATKAAKGGVFTLTNSRNLMHQPLLGVEGQALTLRLRLARCSSATVCTQIYSDATGRNTDQIARDCDRNTWLDRDEMMKYERWTRC